MENSQIARVVVTQVSPSAPPESAACRCTLERRRPLWYTESGAPRFCDFHPLFCADSNADEAALIELKCDACERTINVALTWSSAAHATRKRLTEGNLTTSHSYCYGALPPTGCPAPLLPCGLTQIWVREQGVWLKLDEMLCSSIPFVKDVFSFFHEKT